ncbi:diaminohydroxyphosphoribosylaminopyrimidine deaminase [Halobacteriovorax sp. BALOs_7]|uniref:NAD-dependent epimerase/dehydratase family protein n=1 Tax=Halobacteriovorax sp. BALOs_7 TaxID=2109558 RepID=UPI000EA15FD3|nr:NAD-dependent epimerase/dehydratase family protein [Halobacteriovorax sp. BALOs_7]AYF43850.1 diaminohydroxyphosphoribosylaminopyrimidine deaminase [Halobacteriovorax sp. BALOs_7]
MHIDKDKPILVTGATGYLASWIVKYLLEDGFTVHCAVRDPQNELKTSHLRSLTKDSSKIKFFKSDLMIENSYEEAMKGCEVVIHTASPFFYDLKKDPQKTLVEPALKGTRNILNTVNKIESVKRVVLTSSIASIFGDTIEASTRKDPTFTEADWNDTSSLDHAPYSYSKVMAEKEAWDIEEKQNRWRLVVINPSWIIGPAVNPKASYESKKIFKQFCDGTMALGCPDINLAVVDVRDVAKAHINAATNFHIDGRNIISAANCNLLDIGRILRNEVGGLLFPRFHLPKFLLWLIAPFVDFTREYVKKNVGHQIYFDNSKSLKLDLVNYRPINETIKEYYYQLYRK